MEDEEILKTAYWELNPKGALFISDLKFIEHVNVRHGFYNAFINGTIELVTIKNNIVEVIKDKTLIVDSELKWLDKNFGDKIEEGVYKSSLKSKLLNKVHFLLSDASLMFLPLVETHFHFDSKELAFFYFENCVIQVSKEKIKVLNYSDLDGLVMKQQIIDREFNLPTDDDVFETAFALFSLNVCDKDEERFEAYMTMVGYLLSRFQDPANTKAVVLLDAHINELDGKLLGGRGKSLIVKSLSYLRSIVDIDGKTFSSNNFFSFGSVTTTTNIVCLNDLKENESFEKHFGLTEGITINQKYKPIVKIPFERSPKRVFTSNFMFKVPSGNSSERRLYHFELGNYYGKHLTVYDDFGHYFFSDWKTEQWNEFTLFMLFCVQHYLRKGLIEAESIHIDERRLIVEVGIEYIEFFDQVFTSKTKVHKKELYQEFKTGGYVNSRYVCNQRTFTIKLKKYCEYKGLIYKETPLNTKTFFEIIDENIDQELITIEDVSTDYKIVNTKNKMTRCINKMTEHFENHDDGVLAVDLETTGLDCFQDDIVCMSLTFKERTGYNIVFPKHKVKALKFIEPLLKFLKAENILKVFHNAKFDLKFLKLYGIELNGPIADTMILDHFLDPNRKKHGLKEISELHLGYKQINFKEMTKGKLITEVPIDEVTEYACEDTDLTFQLYHFITNKLKQ